MFFVKKYIKIIFFFIFKKLFLTSTYQNDMKTLKNINLKQKKLLLFLNIFKTQFQTI